MPVEFRKRVKDELEPLLVHWRTIEFWIKRAEQVNKKALIPAINELRYASRQLFQVVRLLEKDSLSAGDKHVINKRLIIAEQYLLNADHDICDSVVGYYEANIEYLDITYGISAIAMFYVEYPKIREHIKACGKLIADSRGEYDDRKKNYDDLRRNHFPHLISAHEHITNAEVQAKAAKEQTERELTIARGRIKTMEKITIAGTVFGLAGLSGLPLSVGLWLVSPKAFCAASSGYAIANSMCAYAAKYESPSANTPSTGAIQDAPAPQTQPLDTAPHSTPGGDPPAKPFRGNKPQDRGR